MNSTPWLQMFTVTSAEDEQNIYIQKETFCFRKLQMLQCFSMLVLRKKIHSTEASISQTPTPKDQERVIQLRLTRPIQEAEHRAFKPGAVAPPDPGGKLPVRGKQRAEVDHRWQVTAGRFAPGAAGNRQISGAETTAAAKEGEGRTKRDPDLVLALPLALGGL